MDSYELQRQIRLILSQARREPTSYVVTGKVSIGQMLIGAEDRQDPMIMPRDAEEMKNEQVLLLRRLYGSLSPELQVLFPTLLTSPPISADAVMVIAHVLVDVRALQMVREMTSGQASLEVWYYFCEALIDRISKESHSLTENDLTEIERLAEALRRKGYASVQRTAEKGMRLDQDASRYGRAVADSAEKIQRLVTRVRYLRLKAELLETANAEINADEQVLLGRIEALGFGRDLQETLHEIQRKAQLATTPADFKTCMDFCRSFLEEFLERAAKRIEQKIAKPIPATAAKSHFQPWYQYLTNAGVITGDEAELLQKFYNHVSNAGSHTLGATSEHARVTKNVVIELTMMIAGRVDDLFR